MSIGIITNIRLYESKLLVVLLLKIHADSRAISARMRSTHACTHFSVRGRKSTADGKLNIV